MSSSVTESSTSVVGSSTSKTYYLKNGNVFKPTPKANLDIRDKLPVGTYNIGASPEGYFLSKIEDFTLPSKIYGDIEQQSSRIMTTFLHRPSSTGVLLAGEKGSGKTLLTKYLAVQAAKQNIPTIVVNNALCGESFNQFMQLIEQPCLVVFDEYEKTYSHYRDQEKLLTLLDGVYASKKLFLLTSNDRWRVERNMLNRPGRIFYVMNFYGLNLEFVKGYAEENLIDKSHVEKVCVVSAVFSAFNLDMLKALIQEMNRYSESPGKALKYLNIRPEFSDQATYSVTVTDPEGQTVASDGDDDEDGKIPKRWTGNPVKEDITIKVNGKSIKFSAEYFSKLEAKTKTFCFVKDKYQVAMTPVKKKDFDWEMLGTALNDDTSAAATTETE